MSWNGGARPGVVTKELDGRGRRAIAHATIPRSASAVMRRLETKSPSYICEVPQSIMEVVLAEGTVTRANQDQNPDLFWVSRLCE
jgi:hypothetical protein